MPHDLDPLLASGAGVRSLRALAFSRPLDVLVPAPHPDDFDAIAGALHFLHGAGHRVHLAVLTTGASGVEDGFQGAGTDAEKAALREQEQRESCARFGLPPDRVDFLSLWADEARADADQARLQDWIAARRGDVFFLPHGKDSNRTHRRTFEAVRAACDALRLPAWAFLNQDAKTVDMRVDVHLDFGEEEAQWKAGLLRCHRSQQERNLRTRGSGFDTRVLDVNRRAATSLGLPRPYAEAFELLRLGP